MQFLNYFYLSVYLHFLNDDLIEANLNNSTTLMSMFLRPTSRRYRNIRHKKNIKQKCQVPDLFLPGLGDRITSDGQVQAYAQQVSYIPDQNKEG